MGVVQRPRQGYVRRGPARRAGSPAGRFGSLCCALGAHRRAAMSADQNKANTEAADGACSQGEAAGAIENMDEGIVWTARGDNSLSGSCRGKQEVGELWGKLAEKGLGTEPHDFVADGDKVVVLTTVSLDGESNEAADVLTYNGEGKLIQFDQIGDPAVGNRVFAR